MKNSVSSNEERRPIVEYLVFSGGGAKGVEYTGVYTALAQANILKDVRATAGSSAGAITAAFVAIDFDLKKMQEVISQTDLPSLTGSGFIINKGGEPLYDMLKKNITNTVLEFTDAKLSNDVQIENIINDRLKKLLDEKTLLNEQEKNNDITKIELKKIAQLKQLNDNNIIRCGDLYNDVLDLIKHSEQGKITFKDLATLRLLEPTKFKDLVITAVRKNDGELITFSANNHPNVEIAAACRASCAIPIYFKPVEIDGEKYVDGGYRDNIPMQYFDDQKAANDDVITIENDADSILKAQQEDRAMIFAFGDNIESPSNIALYSVKNDFTNKNFIENFLVDVIFKMAAKIGGKFKYSEEEDKTYIKLRDDALKTVVLDTGDVGTLSFKSAQNKAQYLHEKGIFQTFEYMSNHHIGKPYEGNLTYKGFMLDCYEQAQKDSKASTWLGKVSSNKIDNEVIFKYCRLSNPNMIETNNLLINFLKESAANNIDTSILKVLNNDKVNLNIKVDFMNLMFDPQDKRFNLDKREVKFIKEDFKQFKAQHVNMTQENRASTRTR